MEEERLAKIRKKKDKKRKRRQGEDEKSPTAAKKSDVDAMRVNGRTSGMADGSGGCNNRNGSDRSAHKKTAADEARSAVQSAVAQSAVLSNLFGTDKRAEAKSAKEKTNALFTRNC